MNPQAPLRQAGIGLRGLILWVWDAIWRCLVSPRVSETSVRRVLQRQAGIAAVESVRVVPGPVGRQHIRAQIRIANGCDAREITRTATKALFRNPSVTEVRLLSSGGEEPSVGAPER